MEEKALAFCGLPSGESGIGTGGVNAVLTTVWTELVEKRRLFASSTSHRHTCGNVVLEILVLVKLQVSGRRIYWLWAPRSSRSYAGTEVCFG